MTSVRLVAALGLAVACLAGFAPAAGAAPADPPCRRGQCPEVSAGQGTLNATYVEQTPGGGWTASNSAPIEHPYTYQLSEPCVVNDRETGACNRADYLECIAPPGRVVEDLIFEKRRLVITDGTETGTTTVDGFQEFGPETPIGTPVGAWLPGDRACVDITALNPPPSPDEVFRYFQTLPLPQLPTRQQPPGNGLVGLPVIFFTDGPTTQNFTVDIRGFTVDITATASTFTWRTGDGTDLTTTDPGAPYPAHTISHDYASGTWTAALTTTWTATFSIDGGLTVPVPGSTTTDGPPVTFDVLQARPVLTNPFD